MTDSVDGVTEYTYDAQGQLLTEKVTPVGSTQATRTTVMTYDNYGNIKTKTTNGTTASYGYNSAWKDKLTTFNGASIVYDNLGNPISYLGHNLTWEKGRQLKSFDNNTYTYNANGIRTSKTVDGVLHTYQLDGTKILKETWGDCTLIPLYDNEDSVCGIIYDDAAYYFHKNLQGDIIGIKNAYGVLVARYTYDAWGKVIAVADKDGFDVSDNAAHVANANPFRYRGYYYDDEIGMYYLQSRYYDPVVGRFINGDDVGFINTSSPLHQNLYCYCANSPSNTKDIFGCVEIDFLLGLVEFMIGVITGLAQQEYYDSNQGKKYRKQIKRATNKKDKREAKRKLKNLLGNKNMFGSTISFVLGVAEWIGYLMPFLIDLLDATYSVVYSIAAMVVDGFSLLFTKLVECGIKWISRLIPTVGFLVGFLLGWAINKMLGLLFSDERKENIALYCSKRLPSSTATTGEIFMHWIKTFGAGFVNSF